MKMSIFRISAPLVAFGLMSLLVETFGNLVIIRDSPNIRREKFKAQLTCVSEDDGAALVWNDDIRSSSKLQEFLPTRRPFTPKCAISKSDGCLVQWKNMHDWQVVDSAEYPMGPVFDYRWEDFEEYTFPWDSTGETLRDVKNVEKSGALVFSARSAGNIHVQLCKGHEPVNDLCFGVLLPVLNVTRSSAITASDFSEDSCNEERNASQATTSFISEHQWRTFILYWNEDLVIVEAYEAGHKLTRSLKPSKHVTRLLVRSSGPGRVRFHFYKYLLTMQKDTTFSTHQFDHAEQNFCIELLVSICSKCELDVSVVNSSGHNHSIGNIDGAAGPRNKKLFNWRVVKLNTLLPKGYQHSIKLQIKTKLNQVVGQGRWAIDNFRKCRSVGALRKSEVIISMEQNPRSKCYTPITRCQRLSYTGTTVVSSNAKYADHSPSRLQKRISEGVKSTCEFPCAGSCKGRSICNPTGCICATGFTGNECDTECFDGYIGYNCLKLCRPCHDGFCDESNSYCVKSWKSYLIWFVVISLLPACLFLLFSWYRRRKNEHAQLKSLPSVTYINDPPLRPIETPDDRLSDCYPHSIRLKTFENGVKRAVQNGELASQFAMLPRGLMKSSHFGNLPKNKHKNRYGNLIAYDDTRVILGEGTINSHFDYINANYIHGYCKLNAYIATQGPMSETIVDFWRMIWQEEVRIICMLTNVIEDGEKMCEQYWPEVGKTMEYGHISVLTMNQRVYAHYTDRTFQLTTRYETGSRKVKHLHYTGWPEQGVPMYSHSIVDYLNELRAIPPGPGPIVVQCSSGTGRTGTIILSDICLRQIAAEGTADLFVEAQKMYSARANMLDNLQQYILAHLMPMQCLLLLPTKLSCSDISPDKIEELKRDLPVHIQRLAVSSWKDKALRSVQPPRLSSPYHMAKNRFPKFTPVADSLVKLKPYPTHGSRSDYISAVSVDGVRVTNQFLASQLPLPSTLSDFWRLVAEKRVELVVILQRPNPEDSSCIDVVPRQTTLIPVPYITVESKMSLSNSNEYFTTDKLLLTDTSEEQPRTQDVTVLTCNHWNLAEDAEPPPPETLVALWLASEKVSRTQKPTLVLCHDGVTGCGLYLALSVLLERMAVEQECDVILAVRAVRRSRPEFVLSKVQFEYLYDAALNFAESFETYGNFT